MRSGLSTNEGVKTSMMRDTHARGEIDRHYQDDDEDDEGNKNADLRE